MKIFESLKNPERPYLKYCIFIGVFLFLFYFFSDNTPPKQSLSSSSSWMKKIDDSTPLQFIAIPGTHDSGAMQESEYRKCQNTTIEEQLEAGIRYLDIRAQPDSTPIFRIFHKENDQKLTFDEVMDICTNFLRQNPSEVILMRLKKENGDEFTPEEFQKKFLDRYHANYKDSFFPGTSVPTLGAMRGKILLLYQNMVSLNFGIPWSDEYINLQDAWLVVQEEKIVKIIEHYIEAEKREANDPKLYLSHFSSTSRAKGINPVRNADYNNWYAFRFTSSKCGVLIFDFPSKELIEHVYSLNYKK